MHSRMEACWQSLAPELVDQVLHHLAPNERATTARRLSKEYHERYKTSLAVHLRRPLPLHALREAFEGPTALPSVLHRDVVAAVAASANLDSLRWISQQGLNWDARACRAAAAEGHAALLSWLMEQGAPVDASVATAAARAGHLALVQQLHAQGCPLNKFTCYAAAERGHLLVLQWVVEVARAPVDARICELAAVNGGCCPPPAASVTQGGGGVPPALRCNPQRQLAPQPAAAPYTLSSRRHHHPCCNRSSRPLAAPPAGHLAVLEYAQARGITAGPTPFMAAAAAEGGHLPVLAWLEEQGCERTEAVVTGAAAHGHMAGVFPCSRPGACLEEER